jgi:DNA-binding Lrp family transcriptional regulator
VQCEVLLSPLRIGISEYLESTGAASIREIAEALDRPRHSLYHHIRRLQEVGILEVVETRLSGAREEAVYDVKGRPMVFGALPDGKKTRELKTRSVGMLLRQTARDYERAIEAGAHAGSDGQKVLQVRRHLGRLSEGELDRLHQHLAAIHDLLRSSQKNSTGPLFAWTSTVVPLG